jgi:N4-gp56 family major capsid protein
MTINYEILTDPMQSMTIDQQKYFAFKIDELDLAQTDMDLLGGYTERAAIAIRNVIDSRLIGHYSDVLAENIIGATTPVALTKATVYDNLVRLSERLDLKNIPSEDRFLVIPPQVKTLLLQSDAFTRATNLGDAVVQNGYIGNVAGFSVHVTTNMPTLAGTVYPIMAFHREFISFASQVAQVEVVRPTDQFTNAVRGLYLYASKVFSPEAGSLLRVTVS